jgi:hypothetical protein
MSRQAGVVAVTSEAHIARGPGLSVLCHQVLELSAALGREVERGASGIISFGIALWHLASAQVTGWSHPVLETVRTLLRPIARGHRGYLRCFHTPLMQISSVWTP